MLQKRVENIAQVLNELIVDFIKKHDKMKSDKFTNEITLKTAHKLWEELPSILNGMPGANKYWHQWLKVSL